MWRGFDGAAPSPIRPVAPSGRPSVNFFHVVPPSVDIKTPRPPEMSLRMLASPVPTQTMFGFDGASAIAPMEATASFSKMGFHDSPPSLVRKTPPAAAPA